MKLITAQQAKTYNIFKKTKQKLLKVKAAIWFNKICKISLRSSFANKVQTSLMMIQ